MTEITIQTSVDIDATVAQAWALFGEGFGTWDQWAPGIDSSQLEGELRKGAVRVNETPSLGTVRQELVCFDPQGRALAYEMRSGLPPFFTSVRNEWVIEEIGPGRCRLTGEARFDLAAEGEAMGPKLEGKMGMTLEVFANAFRDRVQAKV